ncbi:3-oxoadipyl-CoA thiolase [Hymenobacter daecheongensis DSM 21074]|uniref:3-oxoadipyl-CoA thiolase n=1 Tax=Hymenobacter daecheongensis DSM 21074 TaxID=1121955 RepID=A0A1M6F9K3_9BACT|nr:3-oxoadipyl-CoA thiolase [Hymenobacter daecheongensis]SHI94353.1 3-oxoadipyl-CoA thiolase [Hymenobacter daecheongensis DSM 21074]
MKQAYLVDGIRTPIGNFGGTLSPIRPDDMAALVLRELLKRNPTAEPAAVADVIIGCANQAGEDNRNVARMALLLAGLPPTVPGETVNRLCASGLSAGLAAARAIQCGDGDLLLAGGVESMTRAPYVTSKPTKAFGTDAKMFDSSFGWRFVNPRMEELYGTDAMGETAENLVDRDAISRQDQDQFALASQQKAAAAQQRGRLAQEIVGVPIPQRKGEPVLFDQDEFMKPDTTLDGLAKLRPAFRKTGSVTAGNASGLNDGAAALLFASEDGLKQHGLTPKARIVSMGVTGVEPRIMGIGPVPASQQALKKAGLTLDQMDIIELNEAFAAQSLACIRAFGLADNDPRINPNGGAIALGHPLGMSGARLLNTAALELHEQQKRYALVTMCIGVGQGYAVILERV